MPTDAGPLRAALAATWPPAEIRRAGPWILRRGAGGGNRASAASLDAAADADADPGEAEAAMRAWGQPPLFRIGPDEAALDARLAARGYVERDPTLILAAPAAAVAVPPGEAAVFGSGPLACMAEIWAAGGIGPARLAVMARVPEPRCYLLGRLDDRPAGAAFLALAGPFAVLHALEVAPFARRHGLGARMTAAAAHWARAQGAETFALAVTRANAPARALYAAAGDGARRHVATTIARSPIEAHGLTHHAGAALLHEGGEPFEIAPQPVADLLADQRPSAKTLPPRGTRSRAPNQGLVPSVRSTGSQAAWLSVVP